MGRLREIGEVIWLAVVVVAALAALWFLFAFAPWWLKDAAITVGMVLFTRDAIRWVRKRWAERRV